MRRAVEGERVEVRSAGVLAATGSPATTLAAEAAGAAGLDLTDHRSSGLDNEVIERADLILVMELKHKRAIESSDPTTRGKVFRLGEWNGKEIADPYLKPREAFEEALAVIGDCVADWVERLKQ